MVDPTLEALFRKHPTRGGPEPIAAKLCDTFVFGTSISHRRTRFLLFEGLKIFAVAKILGFILPGQYIITVSCVTAMFVKHIFWTSEERPEQSVFSVGAPKDWCNQLVVQRNRLVSHVPLGVYPSEQAAM